MKPRNGSVGLHDSRKPKAGSGLTILGWTIALLVTGPVWLIARIVALIVWPLDEGAYRARLWSARQIKRALGALNRS